MPQQHEPEARGSAGLEHWSFTTPSATLTTRPWSEPSTMVSLRTVSTLEAPSLQGMEGPQGIDHRPEGAGRQTPTMPPPELSKDLLQRDVPDGDEPDRKLLGNDMPEDDELLTLDEVHDGHPDLHFPPPQPPAWRPPAPVGGEHATITFQDEANGEEVVGRRPAGSEPSDPMKILQGIAGVIVMILIAFMT